jgi:hypothetical protein
LALSSLRALALIPSPVPLAVREGTDDAKGRPTVDRCAPGVETKHITLGSRAAVDRWATRVGSSRMNLH